MRNRGCTEDHLSIRRFDLSEKCWFQLTRHCHDEQWPLLVASKHFWYIQNSHFYVAVTVWLPHVHLFRGNRRSFASKFLVHESLEDPHIRFNATRLYILASIDASFFFELVSLLWTNPSHRNVQRCLNLTWRSGSNRSRTSSVFSGATTDFRRFSSLNQCRLWWHLSKIIP